MNTLSTCKNHGITSKSVGGYSSASAIASNVDLLIQILVCLPVKSLLVFKSVSKRWYSVISDPFFTKKHCLQYPHSVNGLFLPSGNLEFISLDGSSPPFETLSFIDDESGVRIVQSCNGLLCCRSLTNNMDYAYYYICNPSTKQYKPIFRESERRRKGFFVLSSVSLAYDPLESPHYKIVCTWWTKAPFGDYPDAKVNVQIEVYSSESDSWKLCGDVFTSCSYIFDNSGVFWNGSLHWVDKFLRGNSVYFNVNRQVRMEMPPFQSLPDAGEKKMFRYFGECRGHLHLIVSPVSHSTFEIFELKTDYTGWSIRYSVNPQDLGNAYPQTTRFSVLLVEDVEKVSSKLVVLILDEVISLDLKDMSFKKIHTLSPSTNHLWSPMTVAYQYIQTLASA